MKEEGLIEGYKGIKIFWRGWIPENYKAILFVSHGLGEHSGRYSYFGEYFSERGFAVFGNDHRGHGESGGRRGHILEFKEYIEDFRLFRESVIKRIKPKPLFLVGHSMGGLIAVHYVLSYPDDFNGLILSSPALAVKIEASKLKQSLGRFFSKYIPALSMGNGLDPNYVSRDKEVVRKYIEDPLVHDRVSARWFTSFLSAIDEAQRRAEEIKTPILLMQSAQDKLVLPEGAGTFFSKLKLKDKELKYWDGLYHEMFNEPEKEQVFEKVLIWLQSHLA